MNLVLPICRWQERNGLNVGSVKSTVMEGMLQALYAMSGFVRPSKVVKGVCSTIHPQGNMIGLKEL